MSPGHVAAGVLQAAHDRQGELVVGADEGVGLDLAGEDAVGDGLALPLAEGDADGRGRLEPPGPVGGDEAGVALVDVGGRLGVTDEDEPGAAVGEARAR